MKKLAQITIALLLTVSPILSFAQDGAGYEGFIYETFETNINNLSGGGNSSAFLKAFSQNVIWVNTDIAIDGRVSIRKLTKENLSKLVGRFDADRQISFKWEITKFNELTVKESTRLAIFEVNVSLSANNEIISSGKNIVEVLAKKIDGNYIITYISVMQIADKVYKGRCFVKINLDPNNPEKFLTQTYYPNGTDYEFEDNEFFLIGSDKLKVVRLEPQGKDLYWNTVQGIVSTDKLGQGKIGDANDIIKVITVILNDKNADNCTHMIITNPGSTDK